MRADADEIERSFIELVRSEAQLRLHAGELLHAMFESRGHHELGFSSIDAYVIERCNQSARWGRETRALARQLRLRGLGRTREALARGEISWSMGALLSRHASRDDEAELVEAARLMGVREMQARLTGAPVERPSSGATETVRARRWLRGSELQMLSISRLLVDHLTGSRASDETTMNALLGEAETSLQSLLEGRRLETRQPADRDARLMAAEDALGSAITRASVLLELPPASRKRRKGVASREASEITVEPLNEEASPPLPTSPLALDEAIVRACRKLAGRSLELAPLARRLLALRMWRRRGYDSPSDYAEQHLGLSLSSLEHLATLARRLVRQPELGPAIASGRIGLEAASMIGRLLGRSREPGLAEAWIQRAGQRTCKHLREEVAAVQIHGNLDPSASLWPPNAEEMAAATELERRVQNGELFRSLLGAGVTGPQTSVTLLAEDSDGHDGLRPLRLTLPDELMGHWRQLESEFHALLGPEPSFVAFMCVSLWTTWLPFLETWADKWAHIYRRDRQRCSSPVCSRRDLTPHHVVPRGEGGGDEDENMACLCAWCHLDGVHGERISVEGPASELRWRIGRGGRLRVRGRRLISATPGPAVEQAHGSPQWGPRS